MTNTILQSSRQACVGLQCRACKSMSGRGGLCMIGCWAVVFVSFHYMTVTPRTFNTISTFLTLSTMLSNLFKWSQHLVGQDVERMLKQMLKPFKKGL